MLIDRSNSVLILRKLNKLTFPAELIYGKAGVMILISDSCFYDLGQDISASFSYFLASSYQKFSSSIDTGQFFQSQLEYTLKNIMII